jgi:hypothetical protein
VRRALLVPIALVAVTLIASPGAGAGAATCSYPAGYPGDSAAKEPLAAWMAGGAAAAGLPRELPVMGAVVDSGLRNLPQGDRDSAGYFQMRVDIWNGGDYAGFPDHPTLQLQWFIDQAQAVRQRRVAGGQAGFGSDPSTWGDWVADVQRPAEQYRGRYQLQLDAARSLIASGCAAADPAAPQQPSPAPDPGDSPPQPDAQLIPDSYLPRLDVTARRYQNGAKTGRLHVKAACSNESCLLRVAGTLAVPRAGVFRLSAAPVQLGRGRARVFRLSLTKRVRKLVAASGRGNGCALAVLRVVAANAGGYRNSVSRTVTVAQNGRACLSDE